MAYGLGATDKFKGTGVFSAIEFEREKKDDEAINKEGEDGKKKLSSSASSAHVKEKVAASGTKK